MSKQSWHQGSRYWRFGMWTVLLSVVLSYYFNDPTPFVAVAPIFLGGAGASNVAERWKPAVPQPSTRDERISDAYS